MAIPAGDACTDARDRLRKAGYGVTEVYRVISAGDSGEGCDVVLYKNSENELYEAFLTNPIRIQPGW